MAIFLCATREPELAVDVTHGYLPTVSDCCIVHGYFNCGGTDVRQNGSPAKGRGACRLDSGGAACGLLAARPAAAAAPTGRRSAAAAAAAACARPRLACECSRTLKDTILESCRRRSCPVPPAQGRAPDASARQSCHCMGNAWSGQPCAANGPDICFERGGVDRVVNGRNRRIRRDTTLPWHCQSVQLLSGLRREQA